MNEKRLHKPINAQQMCFIDIWIRGGRRSKAKALREAGYSEVIARNPSKVFDSPAVQQELERRGYGATGIKAGIEAQPRLRDVRAEEGTLLFNILRSNPEELREMLNSAPAVPSLELEEDRSSIKYRNDLTLDGNLIDSPRNISNTNRFSSM